MRGSPLAPTQVSVAATRHKRFGVAFGPRFFLLLAIGLLWLGPAAFHPQFAYGMLVWDLLVLAAWAADLAMLPKPSLITASRLWSAPAALATRAEIRLDVRNLSGRAVRMTLTDNTPPAFCQEIPECKVTVAARGAATAVYNVVPMQRGDFRMGSLYIRYGSFLRLAERWAAADLSQPVRVYPDLEQARRSLHLIHGRQTDAQLRHSRSRGQGREFESLREYQEGDEFRNICWGASARRGKLISRQFQMERSQPVWLVIDAGRLMRAKISGLSKLDYATGAALSLAEVALASGDKVGLMVYGRSVRSRIAPGRGSLHLRNIMEHLALVKEEVSESNPLQAASTLLATQSRRSLVVWVTDFAETALTPEVLDAVRLLMPRHVVVLLVIGQPDLGELVARNPESIPQMYLAAAAQETVHRREVLLATLRSRGALASEVSHVGAAAVAVNSYLEVKQRNLL
ncbi:MAG: DUF58 domain-containing protein [Acidobacteriota bacterium]|jgi:uncharacterized protein (DUF58 family)|nr:DUF58 domain-containing protein [Acidobacteriota bacterium]